MSLCDSLCVDKQHMGHCVADLRTLSLTLERDAGGLTVVSDCLFELAVAAYIVLEREYAVGQVMALGPAAYSRGWDALWVDEGFLLALCDFEDSVATVHECVVHVPEFAKRFTGRISHVLRYQALKDLQRHFAAVREATLRKKVLAKSARTSATLLRLPSWDDVLKDDSRGRTDTHRKFVAFLSSKGCACLVQAYTVVQLRALCRAYTLHVPAKTRKPELAALLMGRIQLVADSDEGMPEAAAVASSSVPAGVSAAAPVPSTAGADEAVVQTALTAAGTATQTAAVHTEPRLPAAVTHTAPISGVQSSPAAVPVSVAPVSSTSAFGHAASAARVRPATALPVAAVGRGFSVARVRPAPVPATAVPAAAVGRGTSVARVNTAPVSATTALPAAAGHAASLAPANAAPVSSTAALPAEAGHAASVAPANAAPVSPTAALPAAARHAASVAPASTAPVSSATARPAAAGLAASVSCTAAMPAASVGRGTAPVSSTRKAATLSAAVLATNAARSHAMPVSATPAQATPTTPKALRARVHSALTPSPQRLATRAPPLHTSPSRRVNVTPAFATAEPSTGTPLPFPPVPVAATTVAVGGARRGSLHVSSVLQQRNGTARTAPSTPKLRARAHSTLTPSPQRRPATRHRSGQPP